MQKCLIALLFLGLMLGAGCKKNKPSGPETPVSRGEKLYTQKQCNTCHSKDGSKLVGPTLKGIFGKKEIVVTDGKEREITVDETYLRKSVKEPNADVVKGFAPNTMVLPLPVNDKELEDLVAYIKSLK